ncbi:MAG: hypothetical protein CMJ83_16085, partial [Planctomycetes bacterium]|nr:hypothetical protein [Planctomycetota bacterium]
MGEAPEHGDSLQHRHGPLLARGGSAGRVRSPRWPARALRRQHVQRGRPPQGSPGPAPRLARRSRPGSGRHPRHRWPSRGHH